jgi:hypothetical protein
VELIKVMEQLIDSPLYSNSPYWLSPLAE